MKFYFNFNHTDQSQLKVGTLLMEALCRRPEVERVNVADQADTIFNCEPRLEKQPSKLNIWWDNEACNDHCLNGYDYDLILAPYTSRLDQYPPGKTFFFPFATDLRYFRYIPQPYTWDVAFAGREDLDRTKRVAYLDYFSNHFDGPFLRTLGVPRGDATSNLMSRAKVILQVSGDALKGVMETRVFEMGGIGLMAIDRTETNSKDLDWYAEPDADYIAYQSKEELVAKVATALADGSWLKMAAQGVANVKQRHTYDDRAQSLLEHLGVRPGKGLAPLGGNYGGY